MPTPVSRTRSSALSPDFAERHLDLPFERELERVGNQVENDLFPHPAVHVHGLVQAGAIEFEPQPRLFGGRAKHAGQLHRERRQVGGQIDRLHAAGLDAREIQQRVDQPQQPRAVAAYQLQLILGGRRKPCVALRQQVLDGAQHQRQRRAKFMAHVAEERRLGAVDLRQRLEPFPLFFRRARVLDGRRDLPGHQFIECAIFSVQLARRAYSRHQDSQRAALPARRHRQHHRLRKSRCCPTPAGRPSRSAAREFACGCPRLRHVRQRPDALPFITSALDGRASPKSIRHGVSPSMPPASPQTCSIRARLCSVSSR